MQELLDFAHTIVYNLVALRQVRDADRVAREPAQRLPLEAIAIL